MTNPYSKAHGLEHGITQKIAPGAKLKMPALQNTPRAFKTKRFSKTAGDALISDQDLCAAVKEVMAGQADDLGGGVYKKRINKNEHRSVLLATVYEKLTQDQLTRLIDSKDLQEICNEQEKIQK